MKENSIRFYDSLDPEKMLPKDKQEAALQESKQLKKEIMDKLNKFGPGGMEWFVSRLDEYKRKLRASGLPNNVVAIHPLFSSTIYPPEPFIEAVDHPGDLSANKFMKDILAELNKPQD